MDTNELIDLAKQYYCENHYQTYIDETTSFFDELIAKDDVCNVLDSFEISDEEFYCLLLLYARAYKFIQPSLIYCENNPFIELFVNLFDSLLTKVPRTRLNTIYRQDPHIDINKVKELYEKGLPYTPQNYLTCSKDDFDNNSVKLVILPLPNGESRAHEVYLLYNYGIEHENPEYQINFERNTPFAIKSIEEKGNKTIIVLAETK